MKKIMNVSVLFLSLLLILLSSFSKNVNAYTNINSHADKAVKAILNDYYNDGVYRKDTTINLTEQAKAEVTKMFHASCNHLVRTTYYNGEEIWMTNDNGTINSGYETVDGNMMHFRKENGVNVYDYTVENTITTEYYQTLKNLRNTSGWKVSGSSYVNTNEDIIDQFRQFAAPLWLATEEAKDYIIFSSVKIFTLSNGLHIQLLTSSTDNGKLTNSNGIFSEAIVTTNREEKQLEITSVNAYAPEFIKIFTQNYDIKMADYIEAKLINDEGKEYSGVMYDYLEKQSNYKFTGLNLMTGTYEIHLTVYAASAIYKGSVIISNGQSGSLNDVLSVLDQRIDDIVDKLDPENYKEETYQAILNKGEEAKNNILAQTSLFGVFEIINNFNQYVQNVEYDNIIQEELVKTVYITFVADSKESIIPSSAISCIDKNTNIDSVDKDKFIFKIFYASNSNNNIFQKYIRLFNDGFLEVSSGEYIMKHVTITFFGTTTCNSKIFVGNNETPIETNSKTHSFDVNANYFKIINPASSTVTQVRIISLEITYEVK